MATSIPTSRAPGTHKVLLATLLCAAVAASSLPGSSSAATSLVAETCRRTSTPRPCAALLLSSYQSDQSRNATSVRELAVIALGAARSSALRARGRALNLASGARWTVADRLAARCTALYSDCLRAETQARGRVERMPAYDERVAAAVGALRVFPHKCASLFVERKIPSPLVLVSRDAEEKLGIASEIVHLLRG